MARSICYSADYRDNVIFRTFTACILDSEAVPQKVRVSRINGLQKNFISETLADRLGCKVLTQKVSLNIKGYLSNKRVETKIVNVFFFIPRLGWHPWGARPPLRRG